jgi:phospholysine phosphohistidine inorganic pyrophosphate phosphatase
MKALLIDLDGVLYRGDEAIPGAVDAVRWLMARNIPHLFLTNTTSRPRRALVEKLKALGFSVDEKQILTPPVAAAQWLRTHAPGPTALFVAEATKVEFAGIPQISDNVMQGATSVVIGDLGEAWTFHVLNRAFRLLMAEQETRLVTLGLTRYWKSPDGLRLDVAPFCRALECATGRTAVVLGKPAQAFFQTALDLVSCSAQDAVMIGDDIVGDVQGAQRCRLRGLLVRTGKFRPSDLESDITPDAVLDSIADLPMWWESHATR